MIGTAIRQDGAVKPSSLEQQVYEPDLFAQRITEIPSNLQFRADYLLTTDGLPAYTGYAPMGLAEGTNGWLLKKFTYDASRQCTKIQVCTSSNWTARDSTAVYS